MIVGGGFSGTVLDSNLLRRPPAGPTRLVLIERASEVGRGAAYAERAGDIDWDAWRPLYEEGRSPQAAVDRAFLRDL